MPRTPTRRRFGPTRSALFAPLCLLLGPSLLGALPRAAALALVPAHAAADPGISDEDVALCADEAAECRRACLDHYVTAPSALEECLLVCDENYDRCLYERSGGEGCEVDPETGEALACAAVVGTEAALSCASEGDVGCDAACEADPGVYDEEDGAYDDLDAPDDDEFADEPPPDLPRG